MGHTCKLQYRYSTVTALYARTLYGKVNTEAMVKVQVQVLQQTHNALKKRKTHVSNAMRARSPEAVQSLLYRLPARVQYR